MKLYWRYISYLIRRNQVVTYLLSSALLVLLLADSNIIWLLLASVVLLILLIFISWRVNIFLPVICALYIYRVIGHQVDLESSYNEFMQSDDDLTGAEFVIVTDPREGHNSTSYVVKVLNEGGAFVNHKLLVRSSRYPVYSVGERCILASRVRKITEIEDGYLGYLFSRGIVGVVMADRLDCDGVSSGSYLNYRSILWGFKESVSSQIGSKYTEPHASLLLGMIFGDDRLFSDEFSTVLQVTGTTHIIAASGFNVNVVHSGVELIFKRFVTRKYRYVISMLSIWSYAILANLSGSILRAATMSTLALYGKVIGAEVRPFDAIVVTVFILTFIQPGMLSNVGLWLSVTASLGLLFIQPLLLAGLEKVMSVLVSSESVISKISGVSTNAISTVSCTLATQPVVYLWFGVGSFYGVIPNALLLPLVESIFYLGVSSSLFGLLGIEGLYNWISYILWQILITFAYVLQYTYEVAVLIGLSSEPSQNYLLSVVFALLVLLSYSFMNSLKESYVYQEYLCWEL